MNGVEAHTPLRRRGRVVAVVMAVVSAVLLLYATLAGARFELVVAALGMAAGAALVGLLAESSGLSVVHRRAEPRR